MMKMNVVAALIAAVIAVARGHVAPEAFEVLREQQAIQEAQEQRVQQALEAMVLTAHVFSKWSIYCYRSFSFIQATQSLLQWKSGNNASGRAGSLLSSPDYGLLQLTNAQGVPQEAVSICRIASVRITSAVYNEAITYLPAPVPAPTGCGAACESAIRSYLPTGTTGVDINSGGQTVGKGTVIRNEFGMVVLVGPNNSDPTFISTCKAEIITK